MRGWYRRKNLVHMDIPAEPVFVTWRVGDSVPEEALRALAVDLNGLSGLERTRAWRQRIAALLDEGHGRCPLRDPVLAGIVQDALLHYHPERYGLVAWVVMPNHVHAVFVPNPGESTAVLVGRLKSYTAKAINRQLGETGPFWQEDYFDRQIASEEQLGRTIEYIETNPVKAGLVTDARHWRFSSANPDAFARLVMPRG